MRLLPRSIAGRTILMALAVALIGAGTSLLLLFSMPPPNSPPLSLYELGRLARGLPIANEDGTPDARVLARPGPTGWAVDRERSALLTGLLLRQTHLPAGAVRLDVAVSHRYPHAAQRLRREIAMYGADGGANPYLFDSMRLAVRRADGRWTVFERTRPKLFDTWRRSSAGWIVAGLALILPIALLFADRIARPIREFARASARLGADTAAAPIPLTGPAEIAEAAAAFNRMQERIRRHLAERTTTVAAVAHDLRTPLARLRFRIERAPDTIRAKAVADLEEMEAMIAAVLRLAREEGAAEPAERIDLGALMLRVAGSFAEQGQKVVAAPPARPVVAEGDPAALRRAIENLVNNALRFGGTAELSAACEGADAVLHVADRGPGIASDGIARAFDPFWREEGSRNRTTGGAGLGLTIVQAIARRHGGIATLAARDGGGLVATLALPAA